jgi:hypothetical protein
VIDISPRRIFVCLNEWHRLSSILPSDRYFEQSKSVNGHDDPWFEQVMKGYGSQPCSGLNGFMASTWR